MATEVVDVDETVPDDYHGQWIPDRLPGDPPPAPDAPPGFQERALAADETEVFLGGSKGPGKTDLIILKHFEFVHIADGLAVLFREHMNEAQELIDRMDRMTRHFPVSQKPYYVGSPRPRYYWPSGHITEVGSLETLKDVQKIQGRQPWYIGVDELGNIEDPKIVDALMAELRTPIPELPRWFRGSGNPGKPGHAWTKRRYVTPSRNGRRLIRVTQKLPDGSTYSYHRRFIRGYVWDNPVYRQDKQYLAQLMALTPQEREQLLYGNYDAAGGLAFDELDANVHVVPPFKIPASWPRFAGHDWGFAHPCWIVLCAESPDGIIYVYNALRVHRYKDRAQARHFVAECPELRDMPIYSGGDAFAGTEAKRDDYTESTASRYEEFGLQLLPANDSKRARRKVMREYLSWRAQGPQLKDGTPMLYFFDRPLIQEGFRQLEGLNEDKRDPEIVAKTDADRLTGEGGDDFYDALGKALCSHLPEVDASDTAEEDYTVSSHDAVEWLRRARQVSGAHEPHGWESLA